ncbi:MAG: dihydropteroate synthase [Chitinophagaceae bacterium]|nr:dihydropteroate synthase [Chitinophagaceae bacterium]
MFTLNCNGKLLVADKPLVMGIINTTPDSFYADSRFQQLYQILNIAEELRGDGADILDIGGQSTRPFSERVSMEEELERVIPAIEALHYNFPETIISIDTFYSEVARQAIAAGAGMINDISGGGVDPDMIPLAGTLNVPYICVHIKGTPQTMLQHTNYEDVTREVIDYFIHKTAECKRAGIKDVIIDPGFGFAKTIEHNFRLLKELHLLQILEKPILMGISRKGTIYKTLGVTADEALNGTTALNMVGLMNGATILRVHDVKEAVETVKLYMKLK